jgi:hypothetical protein
MRRVPGLGLLCALATATCAPGYYVPAGYQPSERDQRALTGGVIGASAGALIGSVNGSAGRGALIGGALGTLAGALTTPSYQEQGQGYGQPSYGQPSYSQPYAQPYSAPYPPSYGNQSPSGWYDQQGQWHAGAPPQDWVPNYQ